jgi:hypothetical protein
MRSAIKAPMIPPATAPVKTARQAESSTKID